MTFVDDNRGVTDKLTQWLGISCRDYSIDNQLLDGYWVFWDRSSEYELFV